MRAPAPASAAARAYAAAASGVWADTPAVTVTRPSAASTSASITDRRSSALRLPASPMVPLPTTPVMPASSSARVLRPSASRSTRPLASKGVVTAGITPGDRMRLSIARLNVLRGPCPRRAMVMDDPYAILGVDPGAPPAELTAAYREQAKRWHPDRNGDAESERRMAQVNAAYDLLRA